MLPKKCRDQLWSTIIHNKTDRTHKRPRLFYQKYGTFRIQQTLTSSKSTLETQEKVAKLVQI